MRDSASTVENDHPRSFGSQALHEIAKLAKHTLPCGSEDFLLERRTIFLAKKAWHLCQPCRRVIAKRLKQGRSIGSTAQFVQSLGQRQEGLVGSEKFAATTVQGDHAALRHALLRHLDKRRLAYPRLAGDENNLTAPRLDLLQHAFQDLQRNGPPDPPTSALIGHVL